MAEIILPKEDGWADEYVWRVPNAMVERSGSIESEFAKWCRGNFAHRWRFHHLDGGLWNLRLLHADDYLLLIMAHGESPVPDEPKPAHVDGLEKLYREQLANRLKAL